MYTQYTVLGDVVSHYWAFIFTLDTSQSDMVEVNLLSDEGFVSHSHALKPTELVIEPGFRSLGG